MGKHLVFMYVGRDRLAEIQLIFFGGGKGISNHTDLHPIFFSKTAILKNRTSLENMWVNGFETIALQPL